VAKPITPSIEPVSPGAIADKMGNSLQAASQWITDADSAAVCMAQRLAILIDAILDSGEDLDKLASLVSKFESLLKELKLTPLARDKSSSKVEEINSSEQYNEAYLRLISPTNSKPKPKRTNTRAVSKSISK
jgi:hypothetical protein